ncbi:MAG: CPBP family intramembrane glutamic endopeptidase, partial [Propionibacteriaceae bacterium]
MTEQHPDSSAGQNSGPPSNPPTFGPTHPGPGAFPEPGPYQAQPYDPYQPSSLQPGGQPPYPPGQQPQPHPQQPQLQQPPGPAQGYGPLGPPPWRDPLPEAGTEYHRFLRTPRNAWWKGVVAILGFVIGYLIINAVVGVGAIAFDMFTGRSTWESFTSGAIEFTPALFLATNIGNALCIPLAMLFQWWIWGQQKRWLHSVAGVFRWRLLGRSAAIVVPLWLVYMGVSAVAFPQASGITGPSNFTGESVALLVIMLLTTPLQAAGEEYGARGLIMRAAGSWVASPVPGLIIATIVPSLVFMAAHGAGDPWLNVYYFLFGAAMSLLVWRTGGLEAAVVVHAVNNMMAFGIVILAGQEINLDRSAGTGGAFMLVPMAVLLIVALLLSLLARRWKVQRTYQPTGTAWA